jgi:hypothetical protein
MSSTTVLDTIVALVNACTASQDLTGVRVMDGPPTIKIGEFHRLFIGTANDGTGISAEGSNDPILPVVNSETFSIHCLAESWSGTSSTYTPMRAKVFSIRDAVSSLLRPTLQNVVLGVPSISYAYVGEWSLTQGATPNGNYASMIIRCDFTCRPSIT